MEDQKTLPIRQIVLCALFTALIIVGSKLSYTPLGSTVPIVFSNFFAVLAGLVIGPWWGAASVSTYLILGLVGLPVFAKTVGPAAFAGPTGGFLMGFLLAAMLAGLIAGSNKKQKEKSQIKAIIRIILGAISGMAIIYLPGVLWFTLSTGKELGVIVFILPDAIKAVIASALAPLLRRLA